MLVTGATGLLGSEIIREEPSSIGLSSKDCNLLSNHPGDAFKYEISRLRKGENADIRTVVHCAARVGGIKANSDYIAKFFDDNVRMNMNVLNGCKEKDCKLVSVLSTCIYPDAAYVKYPLTENQLHMGPPHESNFGYAYAKRMLDVQARAYRRQWGCNFVNVIPNNLYGLNDNYDLESGHVIPSLIRRFYEAKLEKKSSVVLWGTGKPLREFTFARDAAKIICWISKNYDGGDPVNIGCTKEISIKDLSDIIREFVGFDGEVIWDSSKPDGQFRKPTSNRKLRELGWKEDYTSLEDGLRETVQYFKDNYPNLRGVR